MKGPPTSLGYVCLVAALGLGTVNTAPAQFPPDSLVNLRYFDENIAVRELIGHMRGFSFALGVRCQYCHVGDDDQPLEEFDFASDEKRTKRAARVMLQMVEVINGNHLTDVPARPTPHVEVSCATCHRGLPRPRRLEEVLSETLENEDIETVVERYRELRQEYYGTGSYDFSEFVLTGWAQELARARQTEEAIRILELNAEIFPESGGVRFMVGEVFRFVGDSVQAKAHYDRAITLDSRLQAQVDRVLELMRSER